MGIYLKKAFSHKSKAIQLIKYIWARDANSQKANNIYGMMRRSGLEKIYPSITSDDGILNVFDLTIVLNLLLAGDFHIGKKHTPDYEQRQKQLQNLT